MRIFWEQLLDELKADHRVVLLYVLESFGSSPGRQGFKMFVSESGRLCGSIGGGIMEYKLVEWCKAEWLKKNFKPFAKRQVHQSNIKKDKSGMICSGEQTVAFYALDKTSISLCESVLENIENQCFGSLFLNEENISFQQSISLGDKFVAEIKSETTWSVKEDLGFKSKLFVVGGGHVGLALSKLASQLDFKVVVLDDRDGLNTVEMNKNAHFIKVPTYQQIERFIPEGKHHYVVLMSFGYRTDKVILKRLIGREYNYLGMMGSKAKVEVLFEELKQEGVGEELIRQVYSPIGLPIHSKTPEEIAISILAELIQVKNADGN